MPDRVIRDELLTSERYWAVSMEAQQLYVHLLLVVDDAARFSGKNFTIRASCLPGRAVDPDRLEKMLAELVDVDLLRMYVVGAERYLFVPRFRNRRRYVAASKYPVPPPEINDIGADEVPDISEGAWLKLRAAVLLRDGHTCIRCGAGEFLHAHHLTPRSKGGKSIAVNLATLCRSCNSWAKDNEARCNEIKQLAAGKAASGLPQGDPEAAPGQPQGRRGRSRSGVGEGKRGGVGEGTSAEVFTLKPPESGPKRGSTIPDNFPGPELVAKARTQFPRVDVAREVRKFMLHWRGQSGRAAVKRDWPATFELWLERSGEVGGARGVPGGAHVIPAFKASDAEYLGLPAKADAKGK